MEYSRVFSKEIVFMGVWFSATMEHQSSVFISTADERNTTQSTLNLIGVEGQYSSKCAV
jgi:hypothetical protein